MGAAARKRVEENFNVLTNTRKTAGLLREIALSANKGQPPLDNYNVLQNANGNGVSKKIHYSKQ